MRTKSFRSVVKNYRAVFFDAFGVLKNHSGLIEGVGNTFNYLESKGIPYYVLTNDSSRSPEELSNWYQKRGLTTITTDKILSSGMLAMEFFKTKLENGKAVAYLGTKDSAHYLETAGQKTVPISEVDLNNLDHIKSFAFLDDEGFDWNKDIDKTINLLRHKNMTVIVANTDINYPVNKNDISVAIGGLADLVEQILGKKFIRFGKPDAQMFLLAYERAMQDVPNIQRNEILMVGDTLFTDIIGGNKFGLDTVLVLSGNTLPDNAKIKIIGSGIIPTYVCDSAVIEP
ncbi:HAD-superfamily class IIA hydrolase, TIGR01459 [Draconibacterium orientale]|uniref:HAD-superfamily class IIA hydrolase, TIGR01459 n=1 Tax=Draconibacterium orientale TaxID=1168034 RepID=X5DGC7_9BACT|nr:HAD-IIA family hydrolase [Draconibacterium orientale]AHW60129.1 haloacid dehalogenase [Draconibacterium orientale]SES99878.1 HAD-superfamily class IIA hydrolase, TIGR01459 [Draconibacterium orientale]